jgi:hypothetical protein
MTRVGRVFLGVYSVLLVGAAGGLVAMAWRQDEKLDVVIGGFNLQAFIAAGETPQMVATVVLGLVGLLGVGTLALAFLAGPDEQRGLIRLPQAGGGFMEVPGATVTEMLQDELEQMPDVREARVGIHTDGKAVDVDIELLVISSASVGGVTADAGRAVLVTMRETFGVTAVRRPRVRLVYEEIAVRPQLRMDAIRAERVLAGRAREAGEEETGDEAIEDFRQGDAQ